MRSLIFLVWLFELVVAGIGIITHWDRPAEILSFLVGATFGMAALTLPLALFPELLRTLAKMPALLPRARDTEIGDSFFDDLRPVDPWEMEHTLMGIQGEERPTKPMLTREALARYTRILTTTASLGQTIVSILSRHSIEAARDLHPALITIDRTIAQVVRVINLAEIQLKQTIVGSCDENLLGWPGAQLDLDRARMLLEDSADLVGAAAAFSLQAGLPGDEGYRALSISQLSKADPRSGRINRDGSGRTIRGPGYQPPALDKLLIDHYPFLQSELAEQPIIQVD